MATTPPPGTRVGTLALLRRFPLRSAGGEHPARADVGPGGLAGDRRFVLVRVEDGAVLTARDLPAMAGVSARVSGGELVLDTPLEDLAALAGTAVAVVASADAAGGASHSGGAAVHLVSAGAASAPGAPTGCDPGERANAVLDLDAAAGGPGAERGWVGRVLRVGAVELALTRTPSRCLGVYAEVLVGGQVAVGEAVELGGWAAGAAR